MSIRTNIINCLTADLMNIQTSNGYLNDMKFVKNDVLLPQQVSVYPSSGFVISSDEPSEYLTEDLNLQVRKLGITIAVYTNEENKVLAIENMVSDLNKLFKDDDSILPIYQSQINQIEGTWSDGKNRCLNVGKIDQINDAGIIIYPISIYYLSEYNGNANGSSDLPIIPKILDAYALTSTTNYLQAQIDNIAISGANVWGTITGTLSAQTDLNTVLNERSLTGHTHSVIPNNLSISGSLTVTGQTGIGIINAEGSGYKLKVSGGTNSDIVYAPSYVITPRLGSFGIGGATNTLIDTAISGNILFGVDGTQPWKMVVLSSGNVGINTTTPKAKLSVSGNVSVTGEITAPKIKLTTEGGYAISLTAGETLEKGNMVDISSSGTVVKIVQNQPDPIGAALSSATAGQQVWIVTSGIADVLFSTSVTAGYIARGYVTADAGYVAGTALSEAVPTSPLTSDKHFYEIGHCLETKSVSGLAKVVLHFN